MEKKDKNAALGGLAALAVGGGLAWFFRDKIFGKPAPKAMASKPAAKPAPAPAAAPAPAPRAYVPPPVTSVMNATSPLKDDEVPYLVEQSE